MATHVRRATTMAVASGLVLAGLAAPSSAATARRGFADKPADAGYVALHKPHVASYTVKAHRQVGVTLKGLPVDAAGVTVALSVKATSAGTVTLWRAGSKRPATVTSAFAPGTTAAVTVVANGHLLLLNSSSHAITVAVTPQGYYPSAAKAFAAGAPGWFTVEPAKKAVSVRMPARSTSEYNALLGAPAHVAAIVLAVSATATRSGRLKSFAWHSAYKTTTSLPLVAGRSTHAVEVVQPSGAHQVGLTNLSAGPVSVTAAAVGYVQPFHQAGAPESLSATAGNAKAVLTWQPPADLGGLAVTGYTVTVYPEGPGTGAAGPVYNVPAAQTGLTVPLTNNHSYYFAVAAQTAYGPGRPTLNNLPVVPNPPALPGPPQRVMASSTGSGQATVSWLPPTFNQGRPVSSYTVTDGHALHVVVGGAATSAVLTARPGVTETFSVTADNPDGSSLAAKATAVTILGVPDSGVTTRVSTANSATVASSTQELIGERPSISRGGRFVAFSSAATDLVSGDSNAHRDVFVRDLVTGHTTRVSVASDGTQSDDDSTSAAISDDGRYVAFSSWATTLSPLAQDGALHVYRRDLQTGDTELVSLSSNGSAAVGYSPSISADGSRIAFVSPDSIVTGDTNNDDDVFVRDLAAGTTVRASVSDAGTELDDFSEGASLSADGNVVAFSTLASNVVAGVTTAAEQLYARNLAAGTTTLVSRGSGTTPGDDDSYASALSADGRYVAFESWAGNLVADDTNAANDVFVRDMVTGSTTRVSVAGNGAQTAGDTVFNPVALSADGQRVAFTFPEVGLVPNGSPVKVDTFVHDLGTGATTTTSVASDGTATYADGNAAAISPDGGFVAFDALFLGAAQVDGLPSPGVFLRTLG